MYEIQIAHSEGARSVSLCKYFINKESLTTVKNKLHKYNKLLLFILRHNGIHKVKTCFLIY
jgi:hypothetical protein